MDGFKVLVLLIVAAIALTVGAWWVGVLPYSVPYHETPEFDAELNAALEKNLASMSEIEALKKTARDVCEPHGVECFTNEIQEERTEGGDL